MTRRELPHHWQHAGDCWKGVCSSQRILCVLTEVRVLSLSAKQHITHLVLWDSALVAVPCNLWEIPVQFAQDDLAMGLT